MRARKSPPPKGAGEPVGDLPQEGIPGGMAKGVVDRLEVVEVDDGHGQRGFCPVGPGQRPLEACVQGPSVGKGGEAVVESLMFEALRQVDDLGYVPEDQDEVGRPPLPVARGGEPQKDPSGAAIASGDLDLPLKGFGPFDRLQNPTLAVADDTIFG